MLQIFSIDRTSNRLKLFVDDPKRSETAIPGLVRVKDIVWKNGGTKTTKIQKNKIVAELGRSTRLRSFSNYGNLQVIGIEPKLSSDELVTAAKWIESAKLERVGGVTAPPPDVDKDGNEYDNEYDSLFSNSDDPLSTTTIIVIGTILVALLGLGYWLSKKN